MYSQNQLRALVDSLLVVSDSSAIGCADFAQDRAALLHHIGYSKAAADLNQLTARDDYLSALCQGVQHQQDSGGVVIRDHSGFGSGEPRQQPLTVGFAVTPLAAFQV